MPLVRLEEAAAHLAALGVVGVPTETVYGLAAHGLEPRALQAVYARKGRPVDHPLILHVLDDPDAHGFGTPAATALVAAFWPGPLTIILRRRPHVPDALTGGHPTVALRSPAHPVVRALLARGGFPLAAPSANRFGHVSPTTAAHVLADFPDLPVLDGGPCAVGVESTIIDLSGGAPSLLRPGGIPVEAIEAIIGPVARSGATPAPGTLAAHYAPRAVVIPTHRPAAEAKRLTRAGYTVAVLPAEPPAAYAASLYARLRALDATGVQVIVAEWAIEAGLGIAVNDRLRRASAARRLPIVP